MPNLLELFAGSRAISKEAEKLGMETFSVDIQPYEGIDCVMNIMDFNYAYLPFEPDIIWASPPCTAFSVASIGHHWGGGYKGYEPKTDKARLGIELVAKTLRIIQRGALTNSKLLFYIENPRGLLRKLGILDHIPRHTVTYCQYGDTRMKPTDIWTNSRRWKPRPMCKNGATCHEPAPRGSKSGTQGLKGAYERSVIPPELCREVLCVI